MNNNDPLQFVAAKIAKESEIHDYERRRNKDPRLRGR